MAIQHELLECSRSGDIRPMLPSANLSFVPTCCSQDSLRFGHTNDTGQNSCSFGSTLGHQGHTGPACSVSNSNPDSERHHLFERMLYGQVQQQAVVSPSGSEDEVSGLTNVGSGAAATSANTGAVIGAGHSTGPDAKPSSEFMDFS